MKGLKEIFQEIKFPIIVEGKSDKEVLKQFGLKDIVPLKGTPLFKVAASLSKRTEKVLVLTDFDSEGEKLAKKLNSYLTSFGVNPQSKKRGKIKRIVTKEGISQIENIKPDIGN